MGTLADNKQTRSEYLDVRHDKHDENQTKRISR